MLTRKLPFLKIRTRTTAKFVNVIISPMHLSGGSSENGNRMIRRKVPKGTDFTGITEDETLRVQRWVNEYPRGILGGRCAGRVLMELAQETGMKGLTLLL